MQVTNTTVPRDVHYQVNALLISITALALASYTFSTVLDQDALSLNEYILKAFKSR